MAGEGKQGNKTDSSKQSDAGQKFHEDAKASAAAKKPASTKPKAAKPIRSQAESGKAVNAGPLPGNNTFPESNKAGAGKHSQGLTGPAADSSSGPGGKAAEGGNRGDKGGKGKSS